MKKGTTTSGYGKSYHNTNQLSINELYEANEKAKSLEQKIEEFFRVNRNGNFTPFEVSSLMDLNNIPITSVRRAMTNLTTAGKLEKTNEMRKGQYGQPNHAWRLSKAN